MGVSSRVRRTVSWASSRPVQDLFTDHSLNASQEFYHYTSSLSVFNMTAKRHNVKHAEDSYIRLNLKRNQQKQNPGKAGTRSKTALWEVPHHPTSPRRKCCLGVEACGEVDVATGACSMGSLRRWQCSRLCCGWGCAGRGVESAVPAVGLTQHVV
jgi:hypothetical protein